MVRKKKNFIFFAGGNINNCIPLVNIIINILVVGRNCNRIGVEKSHTKRLILLKSPTTTTTTTALSDLFFKY